jgi:hypothetical protein
MAEPVGSTVDFDITNTVTLDTILSKLILNRFQRVPTVVYNTGATGIFDFVHRLTF